MMAHKKSLNLVATLHQNDFALFARKFSVQAALQQKDNYKLLVIGAGTGGLATSSRFVKKLGAHNVAVVDPSEWHRELFCF